MASTDLANGLKPIILIDDDEDDLELMREGLIKLQCRHPLIIYYKPFEALAHLQLEGTNAHMIACDVHMPLVNAYALREIMLLQNRPVNQVPFFVISSAITDNEIMHMPALQIHHHYIKPLTEKELLNNLNHMLSYASSYIAKAIY